MCVRVCVQLASYPHPSLIIFYTIGKVFSHVREVLMTPKNFYENIGLGRGKKIKCKSASAAGSQHVLGT